MDGVHVIDEELLDAVLERARASARRRTNLNFHRSDDDNPHRFLNVMLRDTYVRPHRHLAPPKSEAFVALRGRVAVFLFDDEGAVREQHVLGDGHAHAVDLQPGIWHCAVVLDDHAVIFEVKPGPWDPSSDKEFASWSPEEGSAEASAYVERLRARIGV